MGSMTYEEFADIVDGGIKSDEIKLAYCPSKRYLDDTTEEHKKLIAFCFLFKFCFPDGWLEYRTVEGAACLAACDVSEDIVATIKQATYWSDTDTRRSLLTVNSNGAILYGRPLAFTLFDVFVKDEYSDCGGKTDGPIFAGTDIVAIDGKLYEMTRFADSELFGFMKHKFAILDCGYYFLHLDKAYKVIRDAIHEYHRLSIEWLRDYIPKED